MIVEIAKDIGGTQRCSRFDLNKTIPVEVSETPRIMLKGKRLKYALSLFSQQEWENIYNYISRNRRAIERHWIGESGSLELCNELK
jgi:hypothetical protein